MLNLHTKYTVLIRVVIWLIKTYGQYTPRKENTKEDTYILQDEDEHYYWAHIKIDSFNNEVKTENVKNEEKVNTKKDYRGEEDLQKTINGVSI